jgi:hypothetical protein
MSGDVTIDVSVVQTEIDQAIQKLDELIEKLQGKNLEVQTSEVDASVEQTIESGELKLDVAIHSAETKVDTAVAEGEKKLDELEHRATATQAGLGNLVNESDEVLKGTNFAIRRVTSMIPGVREAYRMAQSVRRIGSFGLGTVGGAVSLALLVYSIYRMVQNFIKEQEQREKELRSAIKQAQDFTNKNEAQNFINKQNRAMDAWRSTTFT